MVMQGSVVRQTPVLRCLFASILVAGLAACSGPAGGSASVGTGTRASSSASISGSGAGYFLAGRFALEQHDLHAASDYLSRALAGDPDNTELLQSALVALASEGRLEQAADVARRLLNYDSDAGMAAMLVAEQDAKHGRWAAVEDRIGRLPRRGANAFMAPLISAWARAAQGNTDAAIEALAPLSHTSNFAALHDFHAALIADLGDRRALAEQYYRATLSGDGGQALRTVEAATAFYRRTGQVDKANEVLSRYRKQHPDSIATDPGILSARAVATAEEGLAEAFFGAAGSWRQSKVPELALVFGRMAMDLAPDFSLAQVTVGEVLQDLGSLADANEVFATVNPKASVYWSVQLRIATNKDELGDVDGAIKTLEALSVSHPDRADTLVALGDVLRRHERWAAAADAYDRALALASAQTGDVWAVYYSRGIALERSKLWARAENDFLKALELRPDEPHVLNYLGYSWIEQGVNIDQAQKMIEKAVQQRPTDGYIVDSLGWAYYRTGNFPKAVEALERAVELHPNDATINDHLGDALWGVGRQAEARFQWQRALTFKPDAELEGQIQQKLNGAVPPAVAPLSNANAAK